MTNFLQILLLSVGVSIDSLAISLSYGINKTCITKRSVFIISLTSVVVMFFSLVIGEAIRGVISEDITSVFSFGVLFFLGVFKLFQKSQQVHIRKLNYTESFLLGLSMSLDSLAAGIGAGFSHNEIPITLIIVFVMGWFSVYFGNVIGFKLSSAIKLDVSKIGSICIILLSLTKLK